MSPIRYKKISTFLIIFLFFPAIAYYFVTWVKVSETGISQGSALLLSVAISFLFVVLNANELFRRGALQLSSGERRMLLLKVLSSSYYSLFAFAWGFLFLVFARMAYERLSFGLSLFFLVAVILCNIAVWYWSSKKKEKFIEEMKTYPESRQTIFITYFGKPLFGAWLYFSFISPHIDSLYSILWYIL